VCYTSIKNRREKEGETTLMKNKGLIDPTLCGGSDLVESLEVCDEVSVRLQELDVCAISVSINAWSAL